MVACAGGAGAGAAGRVDFAMGSATVAGVVGAASRVVRDRDREHRDRVPPAGEPRVHGQLVQAVGELRRVEVELERGAVSVATPVPSTAKST